MSYASVPAHDDEIESDNVLGTLLLARSDKDLGRGFGLLRITLELSLLALTLAAVATLISSRPEMWSHSRSELIPECSYNL